MSGPEVRGKLLEELCRRIHPVELFELRGQLNLSKPLKPILGLFRGKRTKSRKLPLERFAFGGKPEIVINDFSQKTGQECKRQAL